MYFPPDALSNDIPKYYNGPYYVPGFDNYSPAPDKIFITFVLGYSTFYGFEIGLSVAVPINGFIYIVPSILYSQDFLSAELKVPVQIFKSDDHRFGFEITPVINYSYFYQGGILENNQTNFYSIDDNFFNFGIETSVGYYLLPSVYAGLSLYYSYYNQYNVYTAYDTINNYQYYFTYWNESYYYLCLRYYFIRDLGIEAGLTQLASSSGPSIRAYQAAVNDGNGNMIIFGGRYTSSYYNDIYSYNISAQTWTQLTSSSGPSVRNGPCGTYDGNGNMIVFGGNYSYTCYNDIWKYNISSQPGRPSVPFQGLRLGPLLPLHTQVITIS